MTAYNPQRRSEDRLGRKIYIYGRRTFAVIGIMVVLSIITMCFFLKNLGPAGQAEIPPQTVLTYTFEGELPEVLGTPSLTGPLLSAPATLHNIIDGLDRARSDNRIKGLIARIKPNSLSIAQVQEMRDAIARFRESGKFTYVFAPAYGDFSNGMLDYYLATAFEHIWMQPIGNISITGLTGQLPFLKDTMDKLGVTADMYARAEYKTAVEPMTRSEASPQNREMTSRLLGALHGQMIEGMAQGRNVEPEYIQALVDRAPLFDEQALNARLVDRLGYLDQMVDLALEEAGGKDSAKLWDVDFYRNRIIEEEHPHKLREKLKDSLHTDGKTPEIATEISGMADGAADENTASSPDKKNVTPDRIALVYARGAIMADDGRGAHLQAATMGGPVLSAEDLAIALNSARLDPRVGAIILRINSPGGSATASETIARAIERVQEDGKTVVVSMSTAAASGGYWIAAKADKIVAQPATLTGSVGVLAGKIVVEDLLAKIGVNIEEFTYGEHGGIWSSLQGFSPEERIKINEMLDQTYEAFLHRVSEGRNIPIETLRNDIAGGRVWTGAEAKELGLVDELGGLDVAVDIARPLVNAEHPEYIQVVQYPPQKTPLEMFIDFLVNGAPFQNPLRVMYEDFKAGIAQSLAHPQISGAYAYLPAVR